MRCYFMRGNRIEGVTFLKTARDQDLIREARTLFLARAKTEEFDGFEVWEGDRFIHREHTSDERPAPSNTTLLSAHRRGSPTGA